MAGVMRVLSVDVDGLQDAYERAELRCDELAQAERAAFEQWQTALGAFEVARDESDVAWRAYTAAVAA
jgi:hypothetical protein